MGRWFQLAWIGCFLGVISKGADAERADAGSDYGFEGTIDRMDARFAPDLREGLVVSGVYAFLAGPDAADTDETIDKAVYPAAVGQAELSVDRNHVWIYGARTGVGDGSLELVRGMENAEKEWDLYAVTLPLDGEAIGEDGWRPRWLQLWLYGPVNEMLPNLAAQPPPESFARGWWRITFWNEDGAESALAEGRLTASGEAGTALNPSEQIAALEGVVVELNRQLDSAVKRSRELEAELNTTRKRVDGLQSTIDMLVDEREILRSELARLQAKETETPELLEERIAELEAGEALWEEREDAWKGQNRVLSGALSEAETEVVRLRRALDRVAREEKRMEEPAPSAETAMVVQPEPLPPVPGPIIIIPTPQVVTEVQKKTDPSSVETMTRVEPDTAKKKEASPRKKTPRRAGKFRRGRK